MEGKKYRKAKETSIRKKGKIVIKIFGMV